jgi:hypothetical protein
MLIFNMATRPLTRTLLKSTRDASSPMHTQEISSHSWKGIVTLKPGALKTVVDDVYDVCAFTGLHGAGANHAIIAYASRTLSHLYSFVFSFKQHH